MEKVWRKVGLHTSRRKKKDNQQDANKEEPAVPGDDDDRGTLRSSYVVRNGEELVLVERRRRRRRRSVAKRSPGKLKLFGIEWPLHTAEFRKKCKRKGKDDNELYRSNSFKFERFQRQDTTTSAPNTINRNSVRNTEQLCFPEYCFPLDQLGDQPQQQRSVGFPQNQVEFLENYCDPRDSRRNRISSDLEDLSCQSPLTPPEPAPSQPLKLYGHPYTTDASSEEASSSELSCSSSQCEVVAPRRRRQRRRRKAPRPLPVPIAYAPEHAYVNVPSLTRREPSPSPYYYGDLARREAAAAAAASAHHVPWPLYRITADGLFLEPAGDSSGDSMPTRRALFYLPPPSNMTARARRIYETAFDCKVARSDDDLDDVDRVSNHPILLQLTVDGRVIEPDSFPSSSSSNLDPASSLIMCNRPRRKLIPKSEANRRSKVIPGDTDGMVSTLSQELVNLELNNAESISSRLPLRGYTPSPPSTAPLPTKFPQSKDNLAMNSIKSAPNLPSQPAHPRLKDLRLPTNSLKARDSVISSEGSIADIDAGSNNNTDFECSNRVRNMIQDSRDRISEIKGRPRLNNGLFLEIKGRAASDTDTPEMRRFRGAKESGPILEFKGRPANRRRHNYSSTESMATSSSGGSMESLRSSTSEGNRSTSSSEGRHSASLSSHSSDSGNNSCFQSMHHANPLSGFISHHTNKLHILSPISDKSSQEPGSEMSDNNKNNNSQKVTPDEAENMGNTQITNPENTNNVKVKRRMPQNKNLLSLAFQSAMQNNSEIQGSDSGISIHSRDGIKPRSSFQGMLKLNQGQTDNSCAVDANNGQVDLSELPFDMPKLRRRRAAAQEAACTSGSATSVDLKDLPFDMPKLRRKLRGADSSSPNSSGGSHASSSHSVQDADKGSTGIQRPNLTLNLEDKEGSIGSKEGKGGLNLNFGGFSNVPVLADVVDAELPLEKQEWYHGAMTRIEAESILRGATDGGFLVRNSESAKKDYSLSLKSARGFMHMRIQRNDETGKYILGQFSRPFDTIPEMIRHFCLNRLPVRGAEHMCLSKPVIAQML